MTSTSKTYPNFPPIFNNHLCYRSGEWSPYADLSIAVQDQGFRQGVVAVERLRTYAGCPFQVNLHLQRWQQTIDALCIRDLPKQFELKKLLHELVTRNDSLIQHHTDVGITIFATPGIANPQRDKQANPTLVLHLNQLDQERIQRRRQYGQPIVVTNIQQPSEHSWPRSIKVRARIHYYLGDIEASKHADDAIGVLIDADGSITETSIANLATVVSGQIISPPENRVLGGITQTIVETIAGQLRIPWQKRAIHRDELATSEEILLMGTDGGIWFAQSVNGQTINGGRPGEIYTRLRRKFSETTSQQ